MLSLKDLNAAQEEIYTELLEIFRRQKEVFIERVHLHAQAELFIPVEFSYQEWISEGMFELKGQAKLLKSLGAFSEGDYEREISDLHARSFVAIHEFNKAKGTRIHVW